MDLRTLLPIHLILSIVRYCIHCIFIHSPFTSYSLSHSTFQGLDKDSLRAFAQTLLLPRSLHILWSTSVLLWKSLFWSLASPQPQQTRLYSKVINIFLYGINSNKISNDSVVGASKSLDWVSTLSNIVMGYMDDRRFDGKSEICNDLDSPKHPALSSPWFLVNLTVLCIFLWTGTSLGCSGTGNIVTFYTVSSSPWNETL